MQFLEHPGELITREQLRSLLWPEDTFVDFETGLNTAIKRLRDTLGDAAENPTFIETIPRKGYRFIAPVERPAADGQNIAHASVPHRKRHEQPYAIVALSVLLLLLVAGAVIWSVRAREPRVGNVVALTSDARFKVPTDLPVTDGVHLYFVEGNAVSDHSIIAQVSVAGGETSAVVSPLQEILAVYDIAPDYSELLVGNGLPHPSETASGRAGGTVELWAQPLPGGTPHRVGDVFVTAASYTPDGKQIVFADGHSLIRMNRDGSNPAELAKFNGIVRGIRYSPDGNRIRFDSSGWPFDASTLWELDTNGSAPRPLFPDWKEAPFQCCGSWSSDGKYYFFQARHGNDQAIWAVPEHRFSFVGGQGNASRLISGPLRLSAPVPSRDGKKLFITGEELRVEPMRFDAKTKKFESYMNGASISEFDFSRDGKWVAWVAYPDLSLWRSRTDGTERMQLTLPPTRVSGPHWSPDGSQILFMDVDFDRPWSIGLIPSSGGTPRYFPGHVATWLPDGKSIIYGNNKFGDTDTLQIFRRDLTTGEVSIIPGSDKRFSPKASPNGRYICAFSQPATELMLFDFKTGRWSTLAEGGTLGWDLWSADSKYIYMREIHGGLSRIVRVRVPDGRMEEIVSSGALPQAADLFTAWFGLTPTGDPVLIRDRSTQEIYALEL